MIDESSLRGAFLKDKAALLDINFGALRPDAKKELMRWKDRMTTALFQFYESINYKNYEGMHTGISSSKQNDRSAKQNPKCGICVVFGGEVPRKYVAVTV